jgi:thiol:disulfide interchange protein DsbD
MILSESPLDYLVVFLGGILVSFTPCVYPLIPVTASYIGIKGRGSKLRGLSLSLTFVTGVAIVYSILGLLASLTGTIFGRISSQPIIYLFVGIVIILFGLSMLDLFTITFPVLIKPLTLKKYSYLSTFLLGLSSGFVVSPCLTPVLGSILAYLTTRKNLLYGATLLFSFAYGMGILLILVGTFSAVLINLPKLDKWMIYIKRLSAVVLMGMGIYFIFSGVRRL